LRAASSLAAHNYGPSTSPLRCRQTASSSDWTGQDWRVLYSNTTTPPTERTPTSP
jgi:hypothetical protein